MRPFSPGSWLKPGLIKKLNYCRRPSSPGSWLEPGLIKRLNYCKRPFSPGSCLEPGLKGLWDGLIWGELIWGGYLGEGLIWGLAGIYRPSVLCLPLHELEKKLQRPERKEPLRRSFSKMS